VILDFKSGCFGRSEMRSQIFV